jgi:hypothetical protein
VVSLLEGGVEVVAVSWLSFGRWHCACHSSFHLSGMKRQRTCSTDIEEQLDQAAWLPF